ncbi:disks large 1 tumor suppressor protein-like isoform X1 [Desmodus rotundus]|uniref:disks large 1 tumor suppressor protein-like isoform X1 n=2 Tax=Desmodus rotundus TaxID=9430 RepID=UPI0023817886|nr:disks large 1 tumor suppressor protein-like isoform X1 [Desmodus rotundus]
MPVKKKDTDRALSLLEEYCKKLKKPEEQQLKNAVKKLMGIFRSTLFQALLDIQEFYEVTLLNSQKSCEQKIEEANQVVQKWEKTSLLASCHDNLQKSTELTGCSGPKGNASCIEQNKDNQCSEDETDKKTTQNQGKCPAQNCSVEAPAWMPVHHCAVIDPGLLQCALAHISNWPGVSHIWL